jgi:hypothetical protein
VTKGLKTVVDALRAVASLVGNFRTALSRGEGSDPMSDGIAGRLTKLLDQLEDDEQTTGGKKGKTIRNALETAAVELEKAADAEGLTEAQAAKLKGRALTIRGKLTLFDQEATYGFAEDISAADANAFAAAIGKARDAVEGRKAVKGALTDMADLAVALMKLAAAAAV